MATQVFPPNDRTEAAVHDEVGPFIGELHIVEGSVRGNEQYAEIPDDGGAKQ